MADHHAATPFSSSTPGRDNDDRFAEPRGSPQTSLLRFPFQGPVRVLSVPNDGLVYVGHQYGLNVFGTL